MNIQLANVNKWFDVKRLFDGPTAALILLYACGFISQNSYLSQFRFFSSDLLDKNYLITGFLATAVLALNYLLVYQPFSHNIEVFKNNREWLKEMPKSKQFLYFSSIGMISAVNFVNLITILMKVFDDPLESLSKKQWILLVARVGVIILFFFGDLSRSLNIALVCAVALAAIYCIDDALSPEAEYSIHIDAIFFTVAFFVFYGKLLHPLIDYEIGGGELKTVNIVYVDPTKQKDEGYRYSTKFAPIVYSTPDTIFIKDGNRIEFIKKGDLLSIAEAGEAAPK